MLQSLLDQLSRQCGIGDAYHNWRGDLMWVSRETMMAILNAMGRPSDTDELCEHCTGLRHRCENRQGILPDSCRDPARHDDRAIKKRKDRQVNMRAGKFYLFDVGVAGAITHRQIHQEKGEQFGKALEHFILMEILAHRAYRELEYDVNFWRTKSGLEVDFVLGQGEVGIEVKSADRIDSADLRPLKTFIQEYRPAKALVVCNERAPRVHEDIQILPWRHFLKMLWSGALIS